MNFFRTKVSGNKKRYVDESYNLDLSYITPRVIAMAYPASGFSTVYRNNIDTVSKFLKEKHQSDYMVINLSGKKYDYSKFDNKVTEYEWIDHHAPQISLLFEICEQIHDFLEENIENVIVVNCLAGKGRTGTIICCLMLYCAMFATADQAFEYYSKKRFQVGDGVTQPSQKRYVYYFEKLLRQKIYYPYPIVLYDIEINKIPIKKAEAQVLRPYLEVYLENNDKLYYTNKVKYSEQKKVTQVNGWTSIMNDDLNLIISGDMTLKIFNQTFLSFKKISRVAFNTAFLSPEETELIIPLAEIDPDNLMKKEHYKDFKLKIKYKRICKCNNTLYPTETCIVCVNYLAEEKPRWTEIHQIINNIKMTRSEGIYCLFGDNEDDLGEIFENDEQKNTFVMDRKSIMNMNKKKRKTRIEREKNNSREEGECKIF